MPLIGVALASINTFPLERIGVLGGGYAKDGTFSWNDDLDLNAWIDNEIRESSCKSLGELS